MCTWPQVKVQGRFYSLENLGHLTTPIYASTIRFRSRKLIQLYKNKYGNANEDQQLRQRWKPKLISLIQINNTQISYWGGDTLDTS